MNPDQTVSQMVNEVLSRQARQLAERSGIPFEDASAAVSATEAGTRLKARGEGEHRDQKAADWQANLALERSRRRVGELGWRWHADGSGPPPSEPALPRESSPEQASVHEEGSVVTSEEALVGVRVRVRDDHRSTDLRGRDGTIKAIWGAPEHAALDVLLDNGFSQLFWFHQLRHAGNANGGANGSANGDRDGNGNGSAP